MLNIYNNHLNLKRSNYYNSHTMNTLGGKYFDYVFPPLYLYLYSDLICFKLILSDGSKLLNESFLWWRLVKDGKKKKKIDRLVRRQLCYINA